MKKNKSQKRRIKIAAGLAFTLVIICLAGFAGYKAAYFVAGWNNMQGEESDVTDEVIEDSKFNVLLVGIDRVSESTDVMMLVNVDTEAQSINISSIYRDTRVMYNGRSCKLNSIYKRNDKDIDATIGAIKEITGAPVNYYIMVDLDGFVNIIDELGGVDFYVPRDMYYSDPAQNLLINLKEGQQHLDGEQAMELVRFRKYVQGDVARASVQQDFITALIEQKLNAKTVSQAPELFYKISDYVTTNVSAGVVTANLKLLTKISECTVNHYEMPGEGNYVGNVSYFLQYEDEIYDLYSQYFMGEGAPAVRSYTDYEDVGWPDGWSH